MRWRELLTTPLEQHREAMLALASLLLFALVLTLLQYGRLNERFEDDLLTQANIVARNASAAVVFENRNDAGEILAALDSSPAVLNAQLLLDSGQLLAVFDRSAAPQGPWRRWAGDSVQTVPVLLEQRRVGSLRLRASRAGIWIDLAGFVGTAAVVLAGALGLAWLAAGRLRASVAEAERRTRYLALNDALTDLPNREALRQQLARTLQRCERGGQSAALLIVDLDNFKQINDNHGHAAGDRLLQQSALRLRALARPGDTAARLSSDEFALLLEPPCDEEQLRRLAAAIQAQLAQPVEFDGNWLRVSVSLGGVMLPEHAHQAGEALQSADAAMRQAKRLGKDAFQIFTPEIGQALRERLSLQQDLQAALEQGRLHLAYQPLFDAEGRLCSFEALARWQHPQRGAVSPAEFMPVAEASGLVVELGLLTLQVLRRDLDRWVAAGLDCPPVALNLSSRQCRRQEHRQRLLNALATQRLGPELLEFELTEGSVFEDVDKADSIVATLQGLGYSLAIDDFGTGYSSLAYLRRMRCRKLKIDRLFVHGMAASESARLLVSSMVQVAHAMQMQVVAEGVERPEDWACLVEMGCDLMQGFGLARPLTVEQVDALLRAQAGGARVRLG